MKSFHLSSVHQADFWVSGLQCNWGILLHHSTSVTKSNTSYLKTERNKAKEHNSLDMQCTHKTPGISARLQAVSVFNTSWYGVGKRLTGRWGGGGLHRSADEIAKVSIFWHFHERCSFWKWLCSYISRLICFCSFLRSFLCFAMRILTAHTFTRD